MGLTVKKNTAIGIRLESSEGTFAAAASASDYVQIQTDGFELSQAKEVIERNIFTGSLGKTSPRTGMFTVSGSIPTEMRASATAGNAPEIALLLKSALGEQETINAVTTKSSGNTGSLLAVPTAGYAAYEVGDIIMVKESGAYHVSPISAKSSGEFLHLLVPKGSGSFSNSVVIEKSTQFRVADSGHPSFSLSKWIEGKVNEKGIGCKVTSLAIENFATGQIPTMNFGFEGLNFDRVLDTIPVTPSYQNSLPPILLDGRVYMDSTVVDVNEVSVSLENTLAFQTSINEVNGRKTSRVTERVITGSFNPYKPDDSIANFTKYKENTSFQLFAYGKVPLAGGAMKNVVAIFLRNCLITELAETDQDGLLQDSISFSADRGVNGTTPEIVIAFI